MADWLKVHKTSARGIVSTLPYARHLNRTFSSDQGVCPYTFDVAATNVWAIVSSALREKFPALADSIAVAQADVEANFHAEEEHIRQPFTQDRRPRLAMLISLKYLGSPADLICIAHEFSYAMQIQLTRQDCIAPVLRELAAFIGELVFIDYLVGTKSDLAEVVNAAWRQEDLSYFGSDVDNLKNSIGDKNAIYDYRWNYPVARVLALRLFNKLSADLLWQVFVGEHSLAECIEMAEILEVGPINRNKLPPVPNDKADSKAADTYRSLGMMVLLDINNLQGWSDQSIEKYHADLLPHIKRKTALVVLDYQRKPLGYATWHIEIDEPKNITLTRQSAPFGNYFELQNELKAKLPSNVTVRSRHDRSARKVQVAW